MNRLQLDDLSRMPFGKHKGKMMIDVPEEYLVYLYQTASCHPYVKKYIEERDMCDVSEYGIIKTQRASNG